jgi:hypothetical protein
MNEGEDSRALELLQVNGHLKNGSFFSTSVSESSASAKESNKEAEEWCVFSCETFIILQNIHTGCISIFISHPTDPMEIGEQKQIVGHTGDITALDCSRDCNGTLIASVEHSPLPLVHSFYSTAKNNK